MADFDLVLKRGILYDGTGGSPMRGDVGLRGTRIAAIGPDLAGEDTIDCEGLCVAPGFIDTHSHSDLAALSAPALEMKVRQGIALELTGLDGLGVAPLRTGDLESRRRQVASVLGGYEGNWSWRSVASYLDALDLARPALDLAHLVPHGAIRESIIGLTDQPAAAHDVFRMKGLLARSLDEGAFGFSMGLAYAPCRFAHPEELAELAGVAASRGVPIVVQLRSEGDRITESFEEVVRLARSSGAHVHVAHLKLAGAQNWPRITQVLDAFEAAQREGLKITADLFPYVAGSEPLSAILPPSVLEGGTDRVLERLSTPAERDRIRSQILDGGRSSWDNLWRQAGPAGIVLASLPSGRTPGLVGKDLATIGRELGIDPLEAALDLLRDENLEATATTFDQSEEVIERLLPLPFMNVCTGAQPAGSPHPRAWGAFPRLLARYVREKPVMKLEAAVRKVTGLPADLFGLNDYGYLLEGKRANAVVFDPARVRDTATFEQPASAPEGIPHVIVGGKAVVRDGKLTGERPGRVARRKRS